jgi:hypothetical protein
MDDDQNENSGPGGAAVIKEINDVEGVPNDAPDFKGPGERRHHQGRPVTSPPANSPLEGRHADAADGAPNSQGMAITELAQAFMRLFHGYEDAHGHYRFPPDAKADEKGKLAAPDEPKYRKTLTKLRLRAAI